MKNDLVLNMALVKILNNSTIDKEMLNLINQLTEKPISMEGTCQSVITQMVLIDCYKLGKEKVPYEICKLINNEIQTVGVDFIHQLKTSSEGTYITILKDERVMLPLSFFNDKVSAEDIRNYVYHHFDRIEEKELTALFDRMIAKNYYYGEEYLCDLILRFYNFDKKMYTNVARKYLKNIKSYSFLKELMKFGVVNISQIEEILYGNSDVNEIDAFKLAVDKILNYRGVGIKDIQNEINIIMLSDNKNKDNYVNTLTQLCNSVNKARIMLFQGEDCRGLLSGVSNLFGLTYFNLYHVYNSVYDSFIGNVVYPKYKGKFNVESIINP